MVTRYELLNYYKLLIEFIIIIILLYFSVNVITLFYFSESKLLNNF